MPRITPEDLAEAGPKQPPAKPEPKPKREGILAALKADGEYVLRQELEAFADALPSLTPGLVGGGYEFKCAECTTGFWSGNLRAHKLERICNEWGARGFRLKATIHESRPFLFFFGREVHVLIFERDRRQ
jgi:hypothetical protein